MSAKGASDTPRLCTYDREKRISTEPNWPGQEGKTDQDSKPEREKGQGQYLTTQPAMYFA